MYVAAYNWKWLWVPTCCALHAMVVVEFCNCDRTTSRMDLQQNHCRLQRHDIFGSGNNMLFSHFFEFIWTYVDPEEHELREKRDIRKNRGIRTFPDVRNFHVILERKRHSVILERTFVVSCDIRSMINCDIRSHANPDIENYVNHNIKSQRMPTLETI